MAKGNRNVVFKGNTPKGVAVWPHLTKPDEYNGKESYKTGLRLDADSATALIEKLQPHYDAALAEGKKWLADWKKNPKNKGKPVPPIRPFYTNVCDEDGNETGEVEFKFTRGASGVTKEGKAWRIKKLDLFDAAKNPWNMAVPIYGGSIIRVGFEVIPYATPVSGIGMSLSITGGQVIVLKSGGRDADAYGFDDESDEEGAAVSPTAPEGSSDDDDAGDDDAAGDGDAGEGGEDEDF